MACLFFICSRSVDVAEATAILWHDARLGAVQIISVWARCGG